MYELLRIVFALVLTLAIECGLSLIFKSRQLTYAVLLCNLLTNPLLNFLLLLYVVFFGRGFYFVLLGALELVVVFAEALIIKALTDYLPRKAFLLSLLFNASSFCVGLLL